MLNTCTEAIRRPLSSSLDATSLTRSPGACCRGLLAFACRKAVGFAELSLGQEINVTVNANICAVASAQKKLGPNQKRGSLHFFNFENKTLCVCVCVGGGQGGSMLGNGRRQGEGQ